MLPVTPTAYVAGLSRLSQVFPRRQSQRKGGDYLPVRTIVPDLRLEVKYRGWESNPQSITALSTQSLCLFAYPGSAGSLVYLRTGTLPVNPFVTSCNLASYLWRFTWSIRSPYAYHCIVPPVGFEPTRLSAVDFKSIVSATFTKGAWGDIRESNPQRTYVQKIHSLSRLTSIRLYHHDLPRTSPQGPSGLSSTDVG